MGERGHRCLLVKLVKGLYCMMQVLLTAGANAILVGPVPVLVGGSPARHLVLCDGEMR